MSYTGIFVVERNGRPTARNLNIRKQQRKCDPWHVDRYTKEEYCIQDWRPQAYFVVDILTWSSSPITDRTEQ